MRQRVEGQPPPGRLRREVARSAMTPQQCPLAQASLQGRSPRAACSVQPAFEGGREGEGSCLHVTAEADSVLFWRLAHLGKTADPRATRATGSIKGSTYGAKKNGITCETGVKAGCCNSLASPLTARHTPDTTSADTAAPPAAAAPPLPASASTACLAGAWEQCPQEAGRQLLGTCLVALERVLQPARCRLIARS